MKKNKLIFVSLFMFIVRIYSNEIVYFKETYPVNKTQCATYACSLFLDENGRVKKLNSTKFGVINFVNQDNVQIDYNDSNIKATSYFILEKKDIICDDKFVIKNSNYTWFLENGILINTSTETNNIISYYSYIKKENGYEIDLYYEQDPDLYCLDIFISFDEIKKLKNKDKNINLCNAQTIGYAFPYLLPLLFLDEEKLILTAKSYTATSELKEKNTVYKAENLRNVEGLPWASANGKGINDKIFIQIPTLYNLKLSIYNGFQDPKRRYLYKENSRIKKIRITNLSNNLKVEYDIKDYLEKQSLDLKNLYFGLESFLYVNLEIEILEVYPGEKYDDLCIQAIIPEY